MTSPTRSQRRATRASCATRPSRYMTPRHAAPCCRCGSSASRVRMCRQTDGTYGSVHQHYRIDGKLVAVGLVSPCVVVRQRCFFFRVRRCVGCAALFIICRVLFLRSRTFACRCVRTTCCRCATVATVPTGLRGREPRHHERAVGDPAHATSRHATAALALLLHGLLHPLVCQDALQRFGTARARGGVNDRVRVHCRVSLSIVAMFAPSDLLCSERYTWCVRLACARCARRLGCPPLLHAHVAAAAASVGIRFARV